MFNPFKLLKADEPKKEPEFAGYAKDPFLAMPVKNNLAETKVAENSCVQIRLRVPPKPGIGSFFANKLGFHRDMRLNLDEQGSYFWSLLGNKMLLRDIEKKFRNKYSLKEEDSRRATIQFTRSLLVRKIINLDIGDCPENITDE